MHTILLDTANIKDIESYCKTSAIAGVTTNPTLMSKEGKAPYMTKLVEIAEVVKASLPGVKRHLSVEIIETDPTLMCDQAVLLRNTLSSKNLDLYVKVPITLDNLKLISKLSRYQVQVNATACMNFVQAKMAEDAGAGIVSFFFNRMIDYNNIRYKSDAQNRARSEALEEIVKFCSRDERKAEVICGSIRTPKDFEDCWLAGAEMVTAPPKVIDEMTKHPKTDEAIASFQRDIDEWLK